MQDLSAGQESGILARSVKVTGKQPHMLWVAPSEKDQDTDKLEKRLWDAADQLRANSGLTSAQYSTPVLGLIFLRFADVRFAKVRAVLEKIAA
jgi:type I restriction enzyme M protein